MTNDAHRWFRSVHCSSGIHCVSCRTDVRWRARWAAAGLTPGIEFACPFGARPIVRPGTLLARWLRRFGFHERAGCGCTSWVARMDHEPRATIWALRHAIAEHMVEESWRVLPRIYGIRYRLRRALLFAAALVLIWLSLHVRVAVDTPWRQ